MERTLNLTEVRSQLPALIREAAESSEPIIITTRNEPKALLIGYQAFQRQHRLQQAGARHLLKALVKELDLLLQAASENHYQPGEADLYLFLVQLEKLMQDVWESAELVSRPHALIASQLVDLSRLYLAEVDQPQPAQWAVLSTVINLLAQDTLTMQEAADADRYLLAHGINTMPPIHDALAGMYEADGEDAPTP